MQTRIFKSFFILSLIFVLGGCLGKELPRIQHYELSLDSTIWNTDKLQKNLTKKLHFAYQGTESAVKIANKKIAYKTSTNAIEYFAKNEWIEPLPSMVDSLVLKAAEYSGISLLDSANVGEFFKFQILDLYYDETSEMVVLNLLAKQKGSNRLITREINVQKGGFDEIIKAMNQAVNSALLDSFLLLN